MAACPKRTENREKQRLLRRDKALLEDKDVDDVTLPPALVGKAVILAEQAAQVPGHQPSVKRHLAPR
jgi:hypothetical protein